MSDLPGPELRPGPPPPRAGPHRRSTWARERVDSAEPAALVVATLAVATAVTLTAGLVIAELVDEVMDPDQAVTPDDRIVDWMAHQASPALDTLFRAATRLADYWVATVIVAVAAIVLTARRHRGAAVALIASSAGAMLVTEVLKEIIGRERPPLGGRLIDAAGLAFPSGHSSQSVACYGGLALATFLVTRRIGPRIAAVVAATAIAVLVGTSRVYLGVHWPSDVLAGWIVGLTWLVLVGAASWLLRRLDRPTGWWVTTDPAMATATAPVRAVGARPGGNGPGMSDQDHIREPARDAAATDPVRGEDIPMTTDEAARRRANDGELGDVPQPPGEAGSEAERGAGNDMGLDDPTATEVDRP